jgi:redox-sensitive bicupin YhaK (pirin superfamily)
VDLLAGRETTVGSTPVHRVLPQRARRTVGAWCFADHFGPRPVTEREGMEIGPHPHMGLQTVTWLVAGEVLHRDSLGSEQLIRPGQLNLMTAGHGVAHAEEHTGRYRGDMHGLQLWVAQPESTRHGVAAFEHHDALPQVQLDGADATVVIGDFAGATSPARRDTDHVGVELRVRPRGATFPVRTECEHALIVLQGAVTVDGRLVEPGVLAYLGLGRDECRLVADAPATVFLVGGLPFPEQLRMWWNFVGRTEEELSTAQRQWTAADDRFGDVASPLARIEIGPPPWERRAD